MRGHGLSEDARGAILKFEEYVDDLFELIDEIERDDALRRLGPPVLFVHSMGGLVSIHAALRAPDRIAGLALSSPYLELSIPVPPLKLVVKRALARFVPSVSLDAGVKGSDCTRNTERAASYDKDPMNFKKTNVRWFTEAIQAQERALVEAPKL